MLKKWNKRYREMVYKYNRNPDNQLILDGKEVIMVAVEDKFMWAMEKFIDREIKKAVKEAVKKAKEK